MTITIVHGGQTGTDRGAHEAAIDNGWRLAGYMPRDGRDELGPIPPDVAKFLVSHAKRSYAFRTEANVRACNAVLIVVRDANSPRETPGTTKTIDLAAKRKLHLMIVDPTTNAVQIARWICSDLLVISTPRLPFDAEFEPIPSRLLVAGPRESKWHGARVETAALLGRVALAMAEISPALKTQGKRDQVPEQR